MVGYVWNAEAWVWPTLRRRDWCRKTKSDVGNMWSPKGLVKNNTEKTQHISLHPILSSCANLTFSVLVIPKPLHFTHFPLSKSAKRQHYPTPPSPILCRGLVSFLVVSLVWWSTVIGCETCSYKIHQSVSRNCTSSPSVTAGIWAPFHIE